MVADKEEDEDASGESDGATENENADTGALQQEKDKEKEQETPDENIEEAQRPRLSTGMPSYLQPNYAKRYYFKFQIHLEFS